MPNIVKNTTFIGLLDLLAPHSCRGCGSIGQPLCDCCKNYIIQHHQNFCPVCHQPNSTGKCPNCQHLPTIFVAGKRSDLIGKLIHDFKYQSVRALAHPLAKILDGILPDTDQLTHHASKIAIVPLPTISQHIRERGLDHTYLIAKHLANLRGSNYRVAKFLIRNQDSIQVGSSRETRLAQAASAYTLLSKAKIDTITTYLLLDDVWTTGASFQAAYQLLQDAGAKNIIIATLALSG